MAAVLIMFRTIFCAVPALRRVDPVRISGPTTGAMTTSARSAASCRSLQTRTAVPAPTFLACRKAPRTKGVMPLAEMPITMSCGPDVPPARFYAARLGLILGLLDRAEDRLFAAGDHGLYRLGRHAESRRTFRRIEHAQASAGPRAHVNQPPARAQGGHGEFHGRGDLRDDRRHGRGDGGILGVHQPQDPLGGHGVQLAGGRVAVLGQEEPFPSRSSMRQTFLAATAWRVRVR